MRQARPRMDNHRKAVIYALVACTLWGTVYVAIKVGLTHGMRPLTFAGTRFLASGLILLAITKARGRLDLTGPDFLKISLFGLVQTGLQNALFFTGVDLTDAGTAAIFINTQPFFVILLAPLFFEGSRITALRIMGVLAGFGGVVLAMGGRAGLPEGYELGIVSLVMAGFTWACSSIAAKRLMDGRDPMALTAVQMSVGATPLLAAGLLTEGPFMAGADMAALLVLGYLALFATSIPFFTWYKALSFGEVGRVSVFSFLLPVLGVLSGWLLLGERLNANIFGGMALVAAGIIIVNLGGPGYLRNFFRPSR